MPSSISVFGDQFSLSFAFEISAQKLIFDSLFLTNFSNCWVSKLDSNTIFSFEESLIIFNDLNVVKLMFNYV